MSNNLQINVSISSINTDPIYWCLGAVMNHVSSQLQAITKGKPFSANTFCEQLHSHEEPPSALWDCSGEVQYSCVCILGPSD